MKDENEYDFIYKIFIQKVNKLFGNNFTRSSFDYYGEANYDDQDEE